MVLMNEQKNPNSLFELIKFTLIAMIIILPIRLFVAKPFIVQGASMEPTFHNGQYLIVDQLSYHLGEPQRGDVVVFEHFNSPEDSDTKYYIKRLIGLPGETVIAKEGKIRIVNNEHPQGFELKEAYLHNFSIDNFTDTLAQDEYFVMGDNRPASSDSRSWGHLEKKLIVGKPFARLFPFNQISVYPGQVQDELTAQ